MNIQPLLQSKLYANFCGGLRVLDTTSLLNLYTNSPQEFLALFDLVYHNFPFTSAPRNEKTEKLETLKGIVEIRGGRLDFGMTIDFSLGDRVVPLPVWNFELYVAAANVSERKRAIRLIDSALRKLYPKKTILMAKNYFLGLNLVSGLPVFRRSGEKMINDALKYFNSFREGSW